jgi:hypothetical protein
MKKQIKDLELCEIDYLVAKADGLDAKIEIIPFNDDDYKYVTVKGELYSPTTNPSQAWPIIERERISIESIDDNVWCSNYSIYGKTSLEAAMRAFVASKFGDEIEL